MGLPLSFLGNDDFDFGLKDFITPTPPTSSGTQEQSNKSVLEPPEILQPSSTVEPQYGREGSTESDQTIGRESFGSVIHGSMIDMSPPPEEAPIIPERKADEQVSSEEDEDEDGSHSSGSFSEQEMTGQDPQEDFVDGEHGNEPSLQIDTSLDRDVQQGDNETTDMLPERDETLQQGRNMKLDLDFPLDSFDDDMGLGMDAEFDRVIEAQKVRSDLHLIDGSTY
jgi:hypothetical protein